MMRYIIVAVIFGLNFGSTKSIAGERCSIGSYRVPITTGGTYPSLVMDGRHIATFNNLSEARKYFRRVKKTGVCSGYYSCSLGYYRAGVTTAQGYSTVMIDGEHVEAFETLDLAIEGLKETIEDGVCD